MEEYLHVFSMRIALFVEGAAVVLAAWGAVSAFAAILRLAVKPASHGARKAVWRNFGMWLLLALEFELAAIAVVRTFLNYFLEKDLEHAADEPAEVAA